MEILTEIQSLKGYMVSDDGQVYNMASGKRLAQQLSHRGYMRVFIRGRQYRVHRLVALSHIGEPSHGQEVNHIDGNKTNNSVDNLEWCSHRENMNAYRKKPRRNAMRVMQMTEDGNVVRLWKGVTAAANTLGINRSSIADSCNGLLKKAGGYRWKYYDNQLKLEL